jgi:hypothetical protein
LGRWCSSSGIPAAVRRRATSALALGEDGSQGLDRDRLAQWLFARCVQESIDQPMLADIATRLAPA